VFRLPGPPVGQLRQASRLTRVVYRQVSVKAESRSMRARSDRPAAELRAPARNRRAGAAHELAACFATPHAADNFAAEGSCLLDLAALRFAALLGPCRQRGDTRQGQLLHHERYDLRKGRSGTGQGGSLSGRPINPQHEASPFCCANLRAAPWKASESLDHAISLSAKRVDSVGGSRLKQ